MENSTLVKFGSLKNLKALRDNGELYLNTLDYFWDIEDGDLRGDAFDCAKSVLRLKSGDIEIGPPGGKMVSGKIQRLEYRQRTSEPKKINLFCMYALRPDFGRFPVDGRNTEFGSHALALLQPQEFIDRAIAAVRKSGLNCKAGLVEYVAADFSGELGPFRKHESFQYQSEWRMVATNGPGCPVKFNIGSIAGISKLVPASEINKFVRVDS